MDSQRLARKLRAEWIGASTMKPTLLRRLRQQLDAFVTGLVETSCGRRLNNGLDAPQTDSSETTESSKPSARKRRPRARVKRGGFKSSRNSTSHRGKKDG